MNKINKISTRLRHGEKWTMDETSLMMRRLKSGMDFEETAIKHGRSIGAIKYKTKAIIMAMYAGEGSIDEIVKKTKLNKSMILDMLKVNDKNDKNKKNVDNIDLKTQIVKLTKNLQNIKEDIIRVKNENGGLKDIIKKQDSEIKNIYLKLNQLDDKFLYHKIYD